MTFAESAYRSSNLSLESILLSSNECLITKKEVEAHLNINDSADLNRGLYVGT